MSGGVWRLLAGVVCIAAAAAAHALEPTDEVQAFWSSLRAAMLAGDVSTVQALTRFPFVVAGVDDATPVRRLGRAAFARELPALLGQSLWVVEQGVPRARTMREVVVRTLRLEAAMVVDAATLRVEVFELRREDGRWRFARAWTET